MFSRISRLISLLFVVSLLVQSSPALAAGPTVAQWRVGQPAVRETFDRDNGRWDIEPRATRDDPRAIVEGTLYMRVDDVDTIAWTGYTGEWKDFYLEVDTLHVSGPVVNILGVIFRRQDQDNFYMAMISADGYYAIGKFANGELGWLKDWNQSNAIARGESTENRIGVLAAGSDIVMLVNDEEVARVQDRSYAAGELALLAGTNKDEGGLEVAFDNLQIWDKAPTSAGTARRSLGPSSYQPQPQPTAPARRGLNPARSQTQPAVQPPAPDSDAVVNSDTLNVRAGPGTNYRVLGQLKQGDSVRIIGRTKDLTWVKIALQGQSQAWVAVQYLDLNIDLAEVAVAQAPAAPPATQKTPKNVAYLVVENHIGRYITVQVNDKNFRVEGKVGDVPGRYQFVLQGVGRYTVAAQLPNGGSHNWDLFVEPTPDKCAGRTGCVALGQTFLQTYF